MVAILHKRDSNLNRKENRTFCLPCYWLLTFFLFFLFCRFGVDLKQTKATERKKQKKRNSHTLIGCRKFFLFSFLLRFESRYYPGLNRTPDRNPGSGSDTIYLERDRGRTRHESDPRYIVSDSDMSLLILRECRVRVGRSLQSYPIRTSSHPVGVFRFHWVGVFLSTRL